MFTFLLGPTLTLADHDHLDQERSYVFLTDSSHAQEILHTAGIIYDGEINTMSVNFCRLEAQQECIYGTLCIPRELDILKSRQRLLFFINRQNIVIVDDFDYSYRIIQQIQRKKLHQGETKERFIYNFFVEVMSRDVAMLGRYEQLIMAMEESVMVGKFDSFKREMTPIRRELLTLREYYDELMDCCKELENNENHFFAKKQLKYFGTLADRADRFMGKTSHLLEYALQVKDAYQSQVDEMQNKNMQFLTVISTIFFPLTLITGWYGMNFQNMPELQNGYPYVIKLSIVVLIICILIFKKKKIL